VQAVDLVLTGVLAHRKWRAHQLEELREIFKVSLDEEWGVVYSNRSFVEHLALLRNPLARDRHRALLTPLKEVVQQVVF